MLDKSYGQTSSRVNHLQGNDSRPKPDNIKPPSLHLTPCGLLRRWKPDAAIPDSSLRRIIREKIFIFYIYRINPATSNTVLIRLQADPKANGHCLARPAIAISIKAWTKIFNDGMDQRGVPFEIPSSELDNWRSTNNFLRPPKKEMKRIFGEWIEG